MLQGFCTLAQNAGLVAVQLCILHLKVIWVLARLDLSIALWSSVHQGCSSSQSAASFCRAYRLAGVIMAYVSENLDVFVMSWQDERSILLPA